MHTSLASSPSLPAFRVLILNADRFYAEALKVAIFAVLPSARIETSHCIADAIASTAIEPVDVLVTGLALTDGDALDFLANYFVERNEVRRALVVTIHKEPRILSMLRQFRIDGVFDSAAEGLEQFHVAFLAVIEGSSYWSRSLVDRIFGPNLAADALCRRLTPSEQRVFAAIGDGSDDKVAASRLGMTQTSIHSVRRRLHRKLGITNRGDLIRLALLLGYVRFAHGGITQLRTSSLPIRSQLLGRACARRLSIGSPP